MKIKDILKKVSAGKELTEEEKQFLESYDPESDESRIPKTRLDAEIAKVKAEKERADSLEQQLADAQAKIEEAENAGKTEAEKTAAANAKTLKALQTQVDALTKERDDANAKLAKSERTAKISAIAGKHNFSDSDYLDFLMNSQEVDLDDEGAVSGAMKKLGETRPELFKSTAKPGGGTGGNGGKPDAKSGQARIDELLGKKELTINEANEVAELQCKIAAEGKTE